MNNKKISRQRKIRNKTMLKKKKKMTTMIVKIAMTVRKGDGGEGNKCNRE